MKRRTPRPRISFGDITRFDRASRWPGHFCVPVVILLCLARSALASDIRVATLGGDDRIFVDTANQQHYPTAALEVPHADVELFGEWVEVSLPLSPRQAIGVSFNRPTPRLARCYVARPKSA